ncbi:MAG: hypothetical protein GX053_03540 [Tissierella sp.]|nr:hypothetical protein [Tissierella sp.]
MKKNKVSLLLLHAILLIFVIACDKEQITDTYINEVYGYTFEIPETWKEKKDKIKITEEEQGRIVTFLYLFESDALDRDGGEYQQEFFTISVMSREDYEQAFKDTPYTGNILAEKDEHVYVYYPTLDNIILDKETIDEFNEMYLSLDEVRERFYLNVDIELLAEEIIELKTKISKKDEEINQLKKINLGKDVELKELRESRDMIRFSAYARLGDYNESFDNLGKVYRINSEHEIKDDWYLINNDYFEIELLGYEDALKVDFYILRLESGEGPILLFSDTDHTDGWVYINDNTSERIEKHNSSKGFLFEPYFVIYADVGLGDRDIIKTPKLPIYYR